ncbi:M20/M25/M40 family metallo-hydrolase [Candidatus Poseidonia alphae]|nr:M20/M25/M40 family metallo-hydrolase [Candidatus Poseidonia alphae]
MTVLSFEGLTVNELKEMLREAELPVSGTKAQLIERLQANLPGANTISLDSGKALSDGAKMEGEESVPWYRGTELLTPPALIAIGVAVLMVTAIFVIQPTWLGFEPDYEYELISYDAAQAKNYAETLVSYGHPEWEGRMSGTVQEANTSEYIISQFDAMGMDTTLHSYQVPMHHVNSEPSLRICVQGFGGISPCEGAGPLGGSTITVFQHRVDYVIQGFSGQSEYTFDDDVQLTYLGNGSDESLWQSASGTIGYVINSGTKTGNTEFFSTAAENNLAGLIRVNKDYNCGKIEGNDCVPIFKGTGIDAVKEANGGSIPSDIPFIAMSKDAGDILEAAIFNASGTPGVLEMIMDVTNDQERTIYVPCGEIKGKSSELVIVGGHHDTVYHGEGAIDDTSGTASVLEMARQLSDVVNETGTPERTLRFCTWGGEEEGLYGSRAYVSAFQNSLKDNLRLYINLDMNHVDADFSARGNSLRLFGNTPEDMEHIERITDLYKDKRSDVADRYDIQLALYRGAQGEPDGMPYNSDHGPFVYDLGDDIRGRAVVCYGSGSWEYHTYLDTMDRFNEESLGVSVTIYGTYMRFLAYSDY